MTLIFKRGCPLNKMSKKGSLRRQRDFKTDKKIEGMELQI